ncbi:MAG TPA: superoxide dismutase family protein [Phototrophicaceae bacterium]|nr:superoxide dismutase family protein [Phototrophicaceae bacterium]
MKIKWMLMIAALLSALSAGSVIAQQATQTPELQQAGATALLQDAKGNNVGQVTFSQRADGKVVIIGQFNGLTPGFHGFHIHSVGQCDATSTPPFASAGKHFNPGSTQHPDHAGDLPLILINGDGTGETETVTDRFKLADLFDSDGSSVVIHADPDNYANIPARYAAQPDAQTLDNGDSGDMIACGVIQQDAEPTAG